MKNKKSILIMILVVLLISFVSIGVSIWIISSKTIIKPQNATEAVVKKYLELSCKESHTYNGTIQLPTHIKLDTSELTYYYKDASETFVEVTDTNGPKNVGTYEIQVRYTKTNDTGVSEEITITLEQGFTISPKEISLVWSNTIFSYDGNPHLPTATINNGLITGDICNVSVNVNGYPNGPTEIGSYEAVATIDNSNYTLSNPSSTFTIESLLQELSIEVTDSQSVIYNGEQQGPSGIQVFLLTKNASGVEVSREEINDATLSYQYNNIGPTNYDGLPVDASTYNVSITASKEGFNNVSKSVYFTINKKDVTIEWSYVQVTYDKQPHGPEITSNGILPVDETECIVSVSNQKQTNAGTYTATASLGGNKANNYTLSGQKQFQYAINKKQLTLSKTIYEIAYATEKRTWDFIQSDINPTLTGVITGDIVSLQLLGMYDGTFGYGDTGEIFGLNDFATLGMPTAYKYIVGSTYEVLTQIVGTHGSNYELSDKLYLKYQTAKIGNTYYTIEDALKNSTSSSTIVLCGLLDDSAFVTTSFSKIPNINDVYDQKDTSYYTLNGTLIVPYENSTSEKVLKNGTTKGKVYSLLLVPNNKTFTLNQGAILTVAATIGFQQPNTTISCDRGIIRNDGTINANRATIQSYGYIKGRGLINLLEGSTAIDCMSTYDWPGGNTSTKIYDRCLPLNAWTIHNIACSTYIDFTATYKAFFYAYPSVEASTTAIILAPNGTGDCLFNGKSGNIMKKTNLSDTNINSISGSNQIHGQKDYLEINGEYVDCQLNINIDPVNMTTSTNVALPISYMDITLLEGSNLTLSKNDYLFLPGTQLVINEGATLTTEANVDLSFELFSHISHTNVKSKSYAFFNHCINQVDAQMVVKGTFICEGNLGGLILSNSNTGELDLTKATLNSSFYSLYHAVGSSARNEEGVVYQVSSFYARGYINDSDSLKVFNKEKYTADQISNIWIGNSYDNSITEIDGIMNVNAIKINCFVEGTLITLADGTKKKVEDLTTDDVVLVFNHETGTYDYIKLLFITHENESANNYNILNLTFSNGTTLRIVGSHGLFDMTLRKYVYITYDNVDEYIGHKFYSSKFEDGKIIDEIIELTNYSITYENVRIFCPVSAYYMNCFANDLLTMPNIPYNEDGLVNIFEYDENLQYNQEKMNQDIEKYGLFTYDDFKEYFSYEAYLASPAKYLKISIGKGYITYEEVLKIIKYLIDNTLIS